MGSSMGSRYWVCPSCCRQFDWDTEPEKIREHDPRVCLLEQERDCCGTFPNTPHRCTCPKYRGKNKPSNF
jgi:hypothetical protein